MYSEPPSTVDFTRNAPRSSRATPNNPEWREFRVQGSLDPVQVFRQRRSQPPEAKADLKRIALNLKEPLQPV